MNEQHESIQTQSRWFCCTFCQHVQEYFTLPDGNTTFPRGEWLAHGVRNDYITTDFKTREDAEKYLSEQLAKQN